MMQNERETNSVSDVELSCKIDRVLFKSDLFAICSCVVLEKEETKKIPGPARSIVAPCTGVRVRIYTVVVDRICALSDLDPPQCPKG